LFCLSQLVGAQKTTDVLGWGKTKWDMTEQDIIKIYGTKIIREKTEFSPDLNFHCNLIMKNVKILESYDYLFNVAFCMDNKTNGLTKVHLSSIEGTETEGFKLKSALIDKYGNYNASKLNEGATSTFRIETYYWYLPSTSISLTIILVQDYHAISISYNKAKKEELL